MHFVNGTVGSYRFGTINLRCPACAHKGAFSPLSDEVWDAGWSYFPSGRNIKELKTTRVGIRQCPNVECKAVVFFIDDSISITTYPPEVLDFDNTNLPGKISRSLEEAVKAHAAGCYRASALMVRRVLEELCEDKQAKGKNLMLKLKELSSTIIIPNELLEAADELRLLGNDAAHIEAKTYDSIGPEECEIAIELTKELLKAVYQYTNLVSKLRALKKSPE